MALVRPPNIFSSISTAFIISSAAKEQRADPGTYIDISVEDSYARIDVGAHLGKHTDAHPSCMFLFHGEGIFEPL